FGVPAEVPSSGLAYYLNGRDLSFIFADGASITAWPSSVATPATGSGATAPTFVASAINRQPAARFDGGDDFLTLPPGFSDFTSGMSLFVVHRTAAVQAGAKLLALGNGAGVQDLGIGRYKSTAAYQYWTTAPSGVLNWFSTGAAIVDGTPSLLSVEQ